MLEVINLCVKNGSFELKEINLCVESGSCHVIIGENGVGKTTLLESILGFKKVNSGKIYYNRKDITDLNIEDREFAYIPQDLVIFPNMTVEENIYLIMKANKRISIDEELLLELYEELSLYDKRKTKAVNLSGGEKQKVAILRALASGRKFLIVDEPFSSLDPLIKGNLWQLLKKIKVRFGLSILMVTHDIKEATILGDNLSLISNGKIYKIEKTNILFLTDLIANKFSVYKDSNVAER